MEEHSGLQAERTGLAWYRTASAMMLVAFFSIYIGAARANPAHITAAILAGMAAIAMLIHGRKQAREARDLDVAVRRKALRRTSLTVVAIAALNAAALFL